MAAGERLGDPCHAEERCPTSLLGLGSRLDDRMGDVLAGGDQGRDETGQDAVDVLVSEGCVKNPREVSRIGLGRQRDRAVGDLEPPADARLRGQCPEGVGVADDGHPASAWQRLVNHELRHVEELVHVLHPDHACLAQHGVESGLRHRDGANAVSGGNAIRADRGLDHDHGFAQGQLSRDPGELARVANRLQVQAHRGGVLVVNPVLHEVVTGDVDPVAGRGKDRDPKVAPRGQGEHRDTEGAALGDQAQRPRRWQRGRKGRVQPDVGMGVDDAEGVRADHPHAVAARRLQELFLATHAGRSGLGETSGHHQQGLDAGRGAVLHHQLHRLGGNGDDGKVNLVRDLADP
jgi:hypothetical protein